MKITNKNRTLITDFSSWEKAFLEVDSKKHWREGRSAYSLALHFTSPTIDDSNGIKRMLDSLESLGFKDTKFIHAEIEHSSRFDAYRGNARMQDLIIWGSSNDKQVVICVEAKVDESFGDEIQKAYSNAIDTQKEKPNSKAPVRIKELCDKFFGTNCVNDVPHIRYQLLYYLAGSIKEGVRIGGNVFMPIIVYHTDEYNEKTGNDNKETYSFFMDKLIERHEFEKVEIGNETFFKGHFDGVDVYSWYIEIENL